MSFANYPYRNEEEASEFLDRMRWPDGISCPRCGNAAGTFYEMARAKGIASKRHPDGKVRHGLRKCSACRLEFRSTYGTPFHGMKVPRDVLLAAIVLLNNRSTFGSLSQLSRELGVKRTTVARLITASRANLMLRRRRSVAPNDLTLEPWPDEFNEGQIVDPAE